MRQGLYRSKKGAILGVCRGLAEHFDIPVLAVRLAFILVAICTAIVPTVIAYILAALVMRPEPLVVPGMYSDPDYRNIMQ